MGIYDDGTYCSDTLVEIAREVCGVWAKATEGIPEGAFTFVFVRSEFPQGADIVFHFGTAAQFRGFEGYTAEYGTHAEVRVAVIDDKEEPVTLPRIRRVAMHELGHALGIWGHSPDERDIMSLSGEAQRVTVADVNTLRLAYR